MFYRHDHDDSIPKSNDEIIWTNIKIRSMIKYYFPEIPVFFSIGNNDVLVHDALSPGPNNDLMILKNIWIDDFEFPQKAINSFESGGYYSCWLNNNMKVISLNTLYFSSNNFLSPKCQIDSSSGSIQLTWLKSELKEIQSNGAKAIIIGHIPPQKNFYSSFCLEKYEKIIALHANVISCQLFGHTHSYG